MIQVTRVRRDRRPPAGRLRRRTPWWSPSTCGATSAGWSTTWPGPSPRAPPRWPSPTACCPRSPPGGRVASRWPPRAPGVFDSHVGTLALANALVTGARGPPAPQRHRPPRRGRGGLAGGGSAGRGLTRHPRPAEALASLRRTPDHGPRPADPPRPVRDATYAAAHDGGHRGSSDSPRALGHGGDAPTTWPRPPAWRPAGRRQRGRRCGGGRGGAGGHQPAPVRHGRRPVRRSSTGPASRWWRCAPRAGPARAPTPSRPGPRATTRLPLHGDVRAVTVPGCVDGWIELHRRFGRLPVAQVLEAAITYAATGFPVSPLLAATAPGHPRARRRGRLPRSRHGRRAASCPPGTLIRRPGVATALEAIVAQGGPASTAARSARACCAWRRAVQPAATWPATRPSGSSRWRVDVWGHTVHVPPPPSQGYLTLAAAAVAAGLELPDARTTPPGRTCWPRPPGRWARPRQRAARRRRRRRAARRRSRLDAPPRPVDPGRRADVAPLTAGGRHHRVLRGGPRPHGVTLIQSNASGWGAHIVEPETGIFLHDRGIGFRLDPGHPAELAPGRRPPAHPGPRPRHPARRLAAGRAGHAWAATPSPRSCCSCSPGCWPRPVAGPGGARRAAGCWAPGSARRPALPARRRLRFDLWAGDGPGASPSRPTRPEGWDAGLAERGHEVRRAARTPSTTASATPRSSR